MSSQTQARNPEVDELSCVPEPQQREQAAGVEELVLGVQDPLGLSDTEQDDIGFETQQESDSNDEDTQDTQAAGGGTQKGKGKAYKRSKKPTVLFSAEEEQKLVDFLCDIEILYKQHLMDYKDRSKREVVWDKFCEENNLDKDACQRWFQSQCTLFGKVTHMKLGQGKPQLTEWQKWTKDNFDFLRTTLCAILQQKVNSGPPGCLLLKPMKQRVHHPDGRLCTWNHSRILLVQSPIVTHLTPGYTYPYY